jgi:hypothetical protein
MQNLNHFRSLAEPCDLCPSKTAILKLWRYLRLTDHPNFFTPSYGGIWHPTGSEDSSSKTLNGDHIVNFFCNLDSVLDFGSASGG